MSEPRTIAADVAAGPEPARTETAPDYASAWEAAQSSALALRDALIAAGLGKAVPCLKPEVNIFGDGMLMLGMVGPGTGRRLAELIHAGLAAQRNVRASWIYEPESERVRPYAPWPEGQRPDPPAAS
jgi:hypothetical protein